MTERLQLSVHYKSCDEQTLETFSWSTDFIFKVWWICKP